MFRDENRELIQVIFISFYNFIYAYLSAYFTVQFPLQNLDKNIF